MSSNQSISTGSLEQPNASDLVVGGKQGASLIWLLVPLARAKYWLIGAWILGPLVGYGATFLVDDTYTASFRLLPPQTNSMTASVLLNQVGGATALGSSAIGIKNPADLYAGILRSRAIIKPVIEKLDLVREFKAKDIDAAETRLNESIKITSGKDGILEVQIIDNDAKRSASIGNAMIASLYTLSRALTAQEARRRDEFHNNSVQRALARLRELEDRLLGFEKESGYTRLKGHDESITSTASELQGLISTKELEISAIQRYATQANPELALARKQLDGYRSQLERLRNQSDRFGGLSDRVGQSKPQSVISTHDQMSRIRRDIRLQELVLETAVRVAEAARVDEQRDLSVIQVLDYAEVPTRRSGPKRTLGAIFCFLSFFVASILGVLAKDAIYSDEARLSRWLVLRAQLLGSSSQKVNK
jgi:tyrosine-protein kinase Etk/Wzc